MERAEGSDFKARAQQIGPSYFALLRTCSELK